MIAESDSTWNDSHLHRYDPSHPYHHTTIHFHFAYPLFIRQSMRWQEIITNHVRVWGAPEGRRIQGVGRDGLSIQSFSCINARVALTYQYKNVACIMGSMFRVT